MSDSEDNVLNLCTKKARMSLVANADGSGDDQVTQCHVISNQLGMIFDILLDEEHSMHSFLNQRYLCRKKTVKIWVPRRKNNK